MHFPLPYVSLVRTDRQRPRLTLCRAVLWSTVALAFTLAAAAAPNMVPCGDFESGSAAVVAAGWKLGGAVTWAAGDAGQSAHLRVVSADPAAPMAAVLGGVKVKPRSGYLARYRMRSDGPAHHTFGVLNSKDGSGKPEVNAR